jgi:hypothetical protein
MIGSIVKALFILCCCLIGCGVYKESDEVYAYRRLDITSFIEENHFTTNKPEKIPAKLLRTYNKGCTIYASDTALLRKYDYYANLLQFGISKNGKRGYILTGGVTKNSCKLFSIEGNTLKHASFLIPNTAKNWNEAKIYLVHDNQVFWGGGILIDHPRKKQRQAFSK